MKRRIVSFALALALVFGLSVTASAYTSKQMRAAEALYHLDLFQGRTVGAKDFDLDNTLNRAEGTLMVIRLLGKEEEAYTRDLANTPFPDVATFWNGKAPFIAYAYEEGLMNGVTTYANGVTTLTFEPRGTMNDRMFLTLILRVLGYQDGENNYIWNNAWQLAYDAGLVDSTAKDADFTRGDAVQVAWKAMGVKLQGSTKTLAQKLMGEGLFTAAEYAEAKEIWTYGSIQDDDSGYTPGTPSTPSTPTTPSTPSTPSTPTTPTTPDPGEDNTGTTTPDDNTGTTTPDSGNDNTGSTPDSDVSADPDASPAPTAEAYEAYQAMSGAEQQVFVEENFGLDVAGMTAFFQWFNTAKAAYDAAHPSIEIGGDGSVDLGDLINGQN